MRHAMGRAVSYDRHRERPPDLKDHFAESVKRMIDEGVVAQTPANDLKVRIVSLIRNYSYEIPNVPGKISDLFLDLCDLLVDGELSRMPGDAFKIYLVLSVHRSSSDKGIVNTLKLLQEMTGVSDTSDLQLALNNLKEWGYIESIENPAITGKRILSGKRHAAGDTAFYTN